MSGEENIADSVLISFLPAGIGDCALLQFNGGAFNILVDAGPTVARDKESRVLNHLERLLPGGVIDVAIITHHDDDHIGGFTRLFDDDSRLRIDELIFNAPTLVREFLVRGSTQKISPRQGYLIGERKRPLNHQLVTAGETLRFFADAVELVFLSPTPDIVARYGKVTDWRQPVKISPEKAFRPYEQLSREEDRFVEDASSSNALSLAFEVRFRGRAWLFLGDAWPSVVKASLARLYPEERPAYECVKLSHHGSDGNTDAGLLAQFSCQHYVIPANGRRHPHEQVFRRVMDACGDVRPCFHFPEWTVELDRLLREYRECVAYPAKGELLQFFWDEKRHDPPGAV